MTVSCVAMHELTETFVQLLVIKAWCKEHLKGKYTVLLNIAFFENLEDGAIFKLRWGE